MLFYIFTLFSIISLSASDSRVVIYHTIGTEARFHEVMSNGLSVPNFLFDLRASKLKREKSFSSLPMDEGQGLFFNADRPEGRSVGYVVDATNTFVFNKEFRIDKNTSLYLKSRLILAKFKEYRCLAVSMAQSLREHQAIIFDPLTCEPKVVDITDPRHRSDEDICSYEDVWLSRRHFRYEAEIPLPRKFLSPDELIFSRSLSV